MSKKLWIIFAAIFLFHSGAFGQGLTRIVSGYSGLAGSHAILWIGRDAGIFEKNGLKVEPVLLRSGPTHMQALIAGEIQMGQTGGPSVLAAGVAGADIVFLAVALNTPPNVLMGTVSRVEELKGKAVGVTRYGSNTDFSARFALRKFGLQPDKDVALIQLGDFQGIMGGIATGRVAAGILADPFTDHAAKLGYKELANVANLGLEFPFVGIVTRKSYVRDQPDTVRRYVRAYIEAIALYINNRDLAAKVTGKYTGIKDAAILASTVNFYAPKLSRAPYPTVGGIRVVLEQLAAQNPKAKTIDPETFMDVTFVKQLDDIGFIKSLYWGR